MRSPSTGKQSLAAAKHQDEADPGRQDDGRPPGSKALVATYRFRVFSTLRIRALC